MTTRLVQILMEAILVAANLDSLETEFPAKVGNINFSNVWLLHFPTLLDIDECLMPSSCGGNADCRDTNGSFVCSCKSGFIGDPLEICSGTDHFCDYIRLIKT